MTNTLEAWKTNAPDTLKIDWKSIKKELGFPLHDNFKDFYSRVASAEEIDGKMRFEPAEFVKEYISAKDGWLENANGDREQCEFTLIPLPNTDTGELCEFVKEAFFGDWTGGNDFGNRAYIGELLLNIGEISLIFNNDTGAFEWVDFGYGYFEVYEENPYGTAAHFAQEFLDKFR